MKSLTLAYLFALISAAPNNVSNHSTNQGINQMTTNNCNNANMVYSKSIWITYRSRYCRCYNFRYNSNSFNNQPEDLDYPFEIFTTDASRHLKQINNCNNCNNNNNNNSNNNNNNYVGGSRNLDYEFDTRAKFNKYCGKFEDLGWYCSKGNNNNNNNVANANNSVNNNSNDNTNADKNIDDSANINNDKTAININDDKNTSNSNADIDDNAEENNNAN